MAPNSISLKKSAKVPLLILSWSAGLIGALNIVFFKVAGEILKVHGVDGQNAYKEAPLYLFVMIGGLGAALCVGILNMAMRNYNQLEVMPIYQSSIIVNTLLSGLFILNE